MSSFIQIIAETENRLDTLLSTQSLSRSRAAQLIKLGSVTVNGKNETKPSRKLQQGDEVVCEIPDARETENRP